MNVRDRDNRKFCDRIIESNPDMEWLKDYNKLRIKEEKARKKKIDGEILKEMKDRHLSEKKQELEALEKRILVLKQEIMSLR